MTIPPLLSPLSLKSLHLTMSVNGNALATGTGFVCETKRGPALVTNRHNVTGRNQSDGKPLSTTGGVPDTLTVRHVKDVNTIGEETEIWWIEKSESLYDINGYPKWYEHPILGSGADLVALTLSHTDDVVLSYYNPAARGSPILVTPGEVISVIGFPFGLTAGGSLPIWSSGFIATEINLRWEELPVFLIDCKSRQGQSGSPVVAARHGGTVAMEGGGSSILSKPTHRLLGIYSGRVRSDSDLGMVWNVAAISELLEAI